LYAVATPLGDECTAAIEADEVTAKEESKSRSRKLADKYGWDVNDAKKIWCFGPETSGPNLLVDTTKAV
jgi:elongation factor 2